MARAIFEGPEDDVLLQRAHQMFKETTESGGSTMNVESGEFADPHWGDKPDPEKPSHYIVAGEPHPVTGERYPTRSVRMPRRLLSDAQYAAMSDETRALPELKPEHLVAHQLTIQMDRRRAGQSGPTDASVGTWKVDEPAHPRLGQVDLDVSSLHTDKFTADDLATRRGEEAVFGTNPGRNVPTRIGVAKGIPYHEEDYDLKAHHERQMRGMGQ